MRIKTVIFASIMLVSSISFACDGSVAVYLQGGELASRQGKIVQINGEENLITSRQGKVVKNSLEMGMHNVKVIMPSGKQIDREVHLSCGENVQLFVDVS